MVTARVPPALVRQIEAYAKSSGTSRSADELVAKLESVLLALDITGPPTLGTQRLFAHWASRDGTVKVSEDELLVEVRAVGADEWDQAITEGERLLDRPMAASPEEDHGPPRRCCQTFSRRQA